jgi:hypothetical protein
MTFNSRLRKIEQKARESQPAKGYEICHIFAHLSQRILSAKPELHKVKLCDTDPVTYAQVQHMRSCAAGDVKRAEYWDSKIPRPSQVSKSDTALRDDIEQRIKRQKQALEKARRRLGL